MQSNSTARETPESPARNSFAITKSDTLEVSQETPPILPRAIYVGTGGTIVMALHGDTKVTQTWLNVPSGTVLPVRPQLIFATGTTASDILGIY